MAGKVKRMKAWEGWVVVRTSNGHVFGVSTPAIFITKRGVADSVKCRMSPEDWRIARVRLVEIAPRARRKADG